MKMYLKSFCRLFPAVTLITLVLNSCDTLKPTDENNPCGSEKSPYISVDGSYVTNAMLKATFTNFIVNGEANVAWQIDCTNVCTAEHSDVSVKINVRDVPDIRIEATVLYGFLRERPITLTHTDLGNNVLYQGSDNFGIKDYYGDSPGEFNLILTMYFPSANTNWSADSMYVSNNVIELFMIAHYSDAK